MNTKTLTRAEALELRSTKLYALPHAALGKMATAEVTAREWAHDSIVQTIAQHADLLAALWTLLDCPALNDDTMDAVDVAACTAARAVLAKAGA